MKKKPPAYRIFYFFSIFFYFEFREPSGPLKWKPEGSVRPVVVVVVVGFLFRAAPVAKDQRIV